MKWMLSALVLLLATLLWLVRHPTVSPAGPAQSSPLAALPSATPDVGSTEAIRQRQADANAERADFHQFIATPPNSLSDVPAPAPINLTEDGALVVDAQLRQLFEHYLSALGEESLSQVLVRINYAMKQQLTGAALAQGQALLEAYVQFRNQQGVIRADYERLAANSAFDLDTIRAMKLAERLARQQFFTDAHSQSLFGETDQIEDALLARLAISTDAGLSNDERQRQLTAVTERLSSMVNSPEQQQTNRVLHNDALIQADAPTPEALHQQRSHSFGPAVAQRLAERDMARAQWQHRVARYRIHLQPLLINTPVNAQLLSDLRQYHFSGPDLVRISALDKLELGI